MKEAMRCHWCYKYIEDTTNVASVAHGPLAKASFPLPDTTNLASVAYGPLAKASASSNHVPATTRAPEVTSARPSHTWWSTPLTVRLLIDSMGRLKTSKSSSKDYIHQVQERVASQGNIMIVKEIFTGGDLPEIANYFEKEDCFILPLMILVT